MTTGTQIMGRVGYLLSDEDHVRWTPPELCDWINDGLKAIVLAKPSAKPETRTLSLALGTLQTIAIVAGSPPPLGLVDVVRNLSDAGTGGRAVKPVSRKTLDAAEPDWHNPRTVPFAREVRHICYDEQNPLQFYVYPGNTGTGKVEAVLSVLPTLLAASGDATLEASYGAAIELPETYDPVLLDYVVYRCQSKDDDGSSAGRAGAAFQSFASALGIKIKVEGGSSPNARRAGP